jgi:hypothetical protein
VKESSTKFLEERRYEVQMMRVKLGRRRRKMRMVI